jgi:hypothetical protein
MRAMSQSSAAVRTDMPGETLSEIGSFNDGAAYLGLRNDRITGSAGLTGRRMEVMREPSQLFHLGILSIPQIRLSRPTEFSAASILIAKTALGGASRIRASPEPNRQQGVEEENLA